MYFKFIMQVTAWRNQSKGSKESPSNKATLFVKNLWPYQRGGFQREGEVNAFIVAAPKICGHIREGGLCGEWPLREGPLYRLLSFYMYTHVCPILFLSSFYCTPANVSDPVASNYDCPEGYYCPAGTGLDWKPCPKGTYSNQRNLDRVRLGLGRGKIKMIIALLLLYSTP